MQKSKSNKKTKAYFLVKSEPYKYSFSDLLRDGVAVWDGVRNYEARNNLRAMRKGDEVLFYHSNEGKEIVGLSKVVREAYPDPTSEEDWSVVELAPVKAFSKSLSLLDIKAHKTLSQMDLVKRMRLSVVHVTKEQFECILQLSG